MAKRSEKKRQSSLLAPPKGRSTFATINELPPPKSKRGASTAARPITIDVHVRLQAIAIPEAGGGYSLIVPALPGCISEAETLEEAQANVIEAAEGWLEAQHDRLKAQAVKDATE